ncbi:MAG: DUF2970 domain-containing protein [Alteromonadaceae bacterium]|nr:DUF2970 domain-containing protein [Alteromonadaceae bacterium]
MTTRKDLKKSQRPNLWQVVKSVAASAFGVQSEKNRQLDFQNTSFMPYLIVGVVFVCLFVLSIVFIVSLAIN